MLRDLKIFLLIWNIIGLQPIQNILKNDHTRWKVKFLSFQTLFIICVKIFYMFRHVKMVLTWKRILVFELILVFINVPFDFTQFICCRKLISILLQSAQFDGRELFAGQAPKRTGYRYIWSSLIVVSILAYASLATIFCGWPVNVMLILNWCLYIPAFFARFSVPLSYMFICTELSKRFVALRESCELLGENMSVTENVFIIRPWSHYNAQIVSRRRAYSFLCDLVEDLRSSFHVPIVLFFAITFLEVSWYCYNLVANMEDGHSYRLVRFFISLLLMCMVMERTDNLTGASFDFIRIIRKWPFRYFPPDIQEQLEGFLIQIGHNPLAPRFEDFGYVSVNRKLIVPIMTSFVTYVIVLIQISPRLKTYFDEQST